MDETTRPSIDEVLATKDNLIDLDKAQEAPECIALTMHEDREAIRHVVSEMGRLKGHPKFEKVHTLNKVSKVFDVQPEEGVYAEMMRLSGLTGKTDNIKKVLNSCNPSRREDAYPELPKGKLLYITNQPFDEDAKKEVIKEYLTLQMKETKDDIKKIMEQKGDLDHPVQIPHLELNPDQLQSAISEAFPDESNNKRFCELLAKRLKGHCGRSATTPCVGVAHTAKRLTIDNVVTKFDTRDIAGAIQSLARVIPEREALRVVVKEIAKKIKGCL